MQTDVVTGATTVITWVWKSETSSWLERGLCCPAECRQIPGRGLRCKDDVQCTPTERHSPAVNNTTYTAGHNWCSVFIHLSK